LEVKFICITFSCNFAGVTGGRADGSGIHEVSCKNFVHNSVDCFQLDHGLAGKIVSVCDSSGFAVTVVATMFNFVGIVKGLESSHNSCTVVKGSDGRCSGGSESESVEFATICALGTLRYPVFFFSLGLGQRYAVEPVSSLHGTSWIGKGYMKTSEF